MQISYKLHSRLLTVTYSYCAAQNTLCKVATACSRQVKNFSSPAISKFLPHPRTFFVFSSTFNQSYSYSTRNPSACGLLIPWERIIGDLRLYFLWGGISRNLPSSFLTYFCRLCLDSWSRVQKRRKITRSLATSLLSFIQHKEMLCHCSPDRYFLSPCCCG